MAATKLAFHQLIHSGSVRSRPVFILHGVFGSKRNWRAVAKKLVNEIQRNVYILDARNHGDSPHLPDMSYDVMSEDVAEFIKSQNIEKGTVIGHSMGGKTAMILSLKYPQLVDKLALIDVAPVSSSNTSIMNTYIEALCNLDLKSHNSWKQFDDTLASSIPDKKIRGFLLTNLQRRKEEEGVTYSWISNLQAIRTHMDSISSFPPIDDNVTYTGPTVFIGGANSDYINPSVHNDIKRLFPEAIIQHIEGAGHWVHADKPYELVNALKAFILK